VNPAHLSAAGHSGYVGPGFVGAVGRIYEKTGTAVLGTAASGWRPKDEPRPDSNWHYHFEGHPAHASHNLHAGFETKKSHLTLQPHVTFPTATGHDFLSSTVAFVAVGGVVSSASATVSHGVRRIIRRNKRR